MTATVAHPALEDKTMEALSGVGERMTPGFYESPVAEVEHVERETESFLAWIIVLGFVAYAIALYYAHKCERQGGDGVIKYSILRGFKVKCIK